MLSLGLTAFVVALVGVLNFTVDPYNRFGHNRFGVYISAEREFKATEVRRFPHNALLIGNSRIAMIPVSGLDRFRFFNASLGGATAEEVYYFLLHFASHEQIVILSVELGQTDPPSLVGDIFAPPTWTATLDNLLNLRTAEYSVRTVWSHFSGEPPAFAADGSFDTRRWFEVWDRPDPARLALALEQMKNGYVSNDPSKARTSRNKPPDFKARMSFYSRIAECLQRRGLPCVVVIPPLHEAVARHIQASPMLAAFQAWRRDLDSIFPVVVDLSLSPYGAPENFFKADPLHFKPDVGVRMLNAEVIPVAARMLEQRARSPVLVRRGPRS